MFKLAKYIALICGILPACCATKRGWLISQYNKRIKGMTSSQRDKYIDPDLYLDIVRSRTANCEELDRLHGLSMNLDKAPIKYSSNFSTRDWRGRSTQPANTLTRYRIYDPATSDVTRAAHSYLARFIRQFAPSSWGGRLQAYIEAICENSVDNSLATDPKKRKDRRARENLKDWLNEKVLLQACKTVPAFKKHANHFSSIVKKLSDFEIVKVKKEVVAAAHNVKVTLKAGEWSCKACTFINSSARNKCEICRTAKPENSQSPMISGKEKAQQGKVDAAQAALDAAKQAENAAKAHRVKMEAALHAETLALNKIRRKRE